MAINMQRMIKYRSLENNQYSPTYNRANIKIPADNLQTNLAASYLAFRLKIKSKNGETITSADLAKLTEKDICISFGYEDHAYSPACLIKSAVLKRGNGSIIESIPFSNIISQSMFQLTTNKERLASSNLLNGVALAGKRGESLTKTLSSLYKDYVEVQIPLPDIFEICRSENFWLSETQGLEMSFEMENRLDLLKTILVKSVEEYSSGSLLLNTLELNDNQAVVSSRFETGVVAVRPKVFGASLFQPVSALPAVVGETAIPQFQVLQLVGEYTAQELEVVGIKPDTRCQLVFKLPSGQFFQMMNNIIATTSFVEGDTPVPALIIFQHAWYWNPDDSVEFVRLELTDMIVSHDTPHADLKLHESKIVIDQLKMNGLKRIGLVKFNNEANKDAMFDLSVQITHPQSYPPAEGAPTAQGMIDAKQITYITNERYVGERFYSNAMFRLPITSRGVRLSYVKELEGGMWELEFTSLGMKNSAIGPGLKSLWTDTEVVSSVTNLKFDFIFEKYQMPESVLGDDDLALSAKLNAGLTYEMDRLEVVLNQSTKNKKIPMGTTYNTYAIEPITIQDSVYDFERQFNVLEPSTYNCVVLAPRRGSLVSTLPNIYSYRFQVNNIANTSTDIVLKGNDSDFPSGIHLDKSLDYFANSQLSIRNFFGIGGIDSQSEPVRILPLKIYSANDASNYYINNKMFSVQLAIHSPQSSLQPISEQTIYFVKSVIRVL